MEKKSLFSALTIAIAGAALLAAVTAQSATFQQGVNGYSGHEDTHVRSTDYSFPDTNWGAGDTMSVGSSNQYGEEMRILQRWDLSGLDTSAGVQSATLTLESLRAQNNGDTIHLFALKSGNKDWIEGESDQDTAASGEVTWNSQQHDKDEDGLAWADDELGGGPSLDGGLPTSTNNSYFIDPIGSFSFEDDETGEFTISLSGADGLGDGSLTDLIESWKGSDNAGFLMVPESGPEDLKREIQFATSENSTTGDRPQLEVTLIPEPSTLVLLGLAGLLLMKRRRL